MTVNIVDGFEVIQINVEKKKRAFQIFRQRLEVRVKEIAVGQAGQVIVMRQPFDPLLGFAVFGDIIGGGQFPSFMLGVIAQA